MLEIPFSTTIYLKGITDGHGEVVKTLNLDIQFLPDEFRNFPPYFADEPKDMVVLVFEVAEGEQGIIQNVT